MHGLKSQAGGDRSDAVEGCDLIRLRLREGELRPRQEEVVHEMTAGLAELGEIGDHGLVRLDDVAFATEGPATRVLRGLARHRQVRADTGERVERRGLRIVEPLREARDRDHEADADRESEQREDRSAAAAQEFRTEIPEVEHGLIETGCLKTQLRLGQQRQSHQRSAAVRPLGRDASPVGLRHLAGDREAEPEPGIPRAVGAR